MPLKNPAVRAALCDYYLYHKLLPAPSCFYLALFSFPGGAVGSPLLGLRGCLLRRLAGHAAGCSLLAERPPLSASPSALLLLPELFRETAAEPEDC